MLYMVIETFRDGDAEPVYRRFRERGRMLPEGLEYVESWVSEDRARCFQLMRTTDSLGEGYIATGDTLRALESLRTATRLGFNPHSYRLIWRLQGHWGPLLR